MNVLTRARKRLKTGSAFGHAHAFMKCAEQWLFRAMTIGESSTGLLRLGISVLPETSDRFLLFPDRLSSSNLVSSFMERLSNMIASLDGLRTVSITSVIVTHLFHVPGLGELGTRGNLDVRVIFVTSGF